MNKAKKYRNFNIFPWRPHFLFWKSKLSIITTIHAQNYNGKIFKPRHESWMVNFTQFLQLKYISTTQQFKINDEDMAVVNIYFEELFKTISRTAMKGSLFSPIKSFTCTWSNKFSFNCVPTLWNVIKMFPIPFTTDSVIIDLCQSFDLRVF